MVVDHLRSKFADKDDVGVSFAYCSHQERTKQTPVTLIGSLLKQLVQERPALCELVMPLYKNHRKCNTSPTLPEVSKALQKITAQYKRVFMVVDALDECQEDYGFRDHLLEELGSLDSQVSLLLTSRTHISVEYDFESAVPIEIRASEVDLRKYLEQRLARATRLVRYVRPDPELKTAIIETLLGNARGMFLLAQLHMDLVVAKATQNEIRKALENLPQGLDESYRDALKRIESQNHDDCQRAKRTIYWTSHVLRPLAVTEMQSALAVVPKTKRLDHGDIIHHDILLSICAGLIVIDSESNHFRLVHYTAQKYFEGVRAELFPDAQADIAGTCITYLSYDVFAEGPCPSKELFEARLNANALLAYAAENWGKHLRGRPEEQPHLQEQALGFLDDDMTASAAVQVAYVNRYGSKERPEVFSTGVRPLQLAASFGLSRIVKFLVERGDDVQSADSEGTTALHEAAAFGDDGILKLLLEHGADVAASTKDGATSLCNAIVGGNDSSALLLLDVGSDLEAKDPYEGTVIHSAAYNRDLKALELLLSRGANVSAIDSHGNTPLHIAAYCGEEAMARLLLAHGAPAGEKNKFECSPLHYAAYMAHESLTKLLLENSVDANSGDYFGSTPLHFATDSGNEAVVKLLLDHGADVHAQAKHGCWAERTIGEEEGEEEVSIAAPLLFEDGQDSFLKREMTKNDGTLRRTNTDMRRNPMVQSSMVEGSVYMFPTITYGGAPINVAAYRGRLEAVRLLLARGADPKSKDSVGAPAFWRAAFGGHDAIVALLHEHGVDVNTKDEGTEDPYGPWIADQGLTKSLHGTALSRAAWQGHQSTVRLLLSLGAKTELKDSNGATVLHMAATQHTTENADIVKALLEYGAIIDAKDGEACTSLLRAAYARNPAIVEALLAAGADVQATKDGATAFHMIVSSEEEACYNDYHDLSACDHCKGGEKVLHIFLNRGVDINARDDEGMTALFYAVLNGHAIIASQLIDHGADLEVKDKAGLPVLHKAVEDDHVDTVRWLCEKGLNLEALDDEGFTALYSAIDTQNVAMARLLVEKGANVNGLNPELETPLAAAMRRGPAAIAHLLLSNDIDIPNREDALIDAVERGKENAVKFLLENGARGISPVKYRLPKAPSKEYPAIEEEAVNSSQGAKDIVIEIREDGRKEGNDEEDAKEDDEKEEDSAAVIAVCGDKESILKLLLAHNAYDEGDKLLYFALSTGHNHLAEILLNHGISIEVRNKYGCTALHNTAAYGEVDAMRWLLSHGADLKAEQVGDCYDGGPTPLFWAANNGHIEALKILLDAYNPYETERGREEEWALKAAAVNGYTDAVTLLLDHGADMEKKFEAGGTTLYWAASCGQEAVVRLLVERGADPGAVDEDGFTAAYWATHHGHNQVSALLDRSEKTTLTASDVSINAK
jgi:ankyrin repeat protein